MSKPDLASFTPLSTGPNPQKCWLSAYLLLQRNMPVFF
jgi:hypothetical protein